MPNNCHKLTKANNEKKSVGFLYGEFNFLRQYLRFSDISVKFSEKPAENTLSDLSITSTKFQECPTPTAQNFEQMCNDSK